MEMISLTRVQYNYIDQGNSEVHNGRAAEAEMFEMGARSGGILGDITGFVAGLILHKVKDGVPGVIIKYLACRFYFLSYLIIQP